MEQKSAGCCANDRSAPQRSGPKKVDEVTSARLDLSNLTEFGTARDVKVWASAADRWRSSAWA